MSENTNNTAALSEVTAAADQATEVGGVLESALPVVNADQVAHIRALNKQGESINITKEESQNLILSDDVKTRVQTLAGMDYSLLTEQIVPGEFAPSTDGTMKQIYGMRVRRSATLILVENQGYYQFKPLISGVDTVVKSQGYISIPVSNDDGTMTTNRLKIQLTGSIYETYFRASLRIFENSAFWGSNTISLDVRVNDPNSAGKEVIVDAFFFYTKK